jgi:hypothetical protein
MSGNHESSHYAQRLFVGRDREYQLYRGSSGKQTPYSAHLDGGDVSVLFEN